MFRCFSGPYEPLTRLNRQVRVTRRTPRKTIIDIAIYLIVKLLKRLGAQQQQQQQQTVEASHAVLPEPFATRIHELGKATNDTHTSGKRYGADGSTNAILYYCSGY